MDKKVYLPVFSCLMILLQEREREREKVGHQTRMTIALQQILLSSEPISLIYVIRKLRSGRERNWSKNYQQQDSKRYDIWVSKV